jgi:hypothetical protein
LKASIFSAFLPEIKFCIMKQLFLFLAMAMLMAACNFETKEDVKMEKSPISETTINELVDSLKKANPDVNAVRIEKGVQQVAGLWRDDDGTETNFRSFVAESFIANADERKIALNKLERNFEILYGYFHRIDVDLMAPLHLDMGELHPLDYQFGAYSASAHLTEDMYANKIAFYVVLNFPAYSLEEKMEYGENWSRFDWAAARAGDLFDARIPANLLQESSLAATNSDTYISTYNIHMGQLVNNENEHLFDKDKVLITHWGLRDELKSHYGTKNQEAQEMIYHVMLNIVNQSIAADMIDSDEYDWNPKTNTYYKDGNEVQLEREQDMRYQHLLNNFHAMKAMDAYTPLYPSYIDRAFSQNMEITQPEVEALFREFISSDVVKDVAALISERLGRELCPYDIWYDGFKSRTGINEAELDAITRERYPNPEALNADLPNLLMNLGWDKETAEDISEKIVVDPARGAGHAWGAEMKSDVSHLRTRIPETGMDYKGYNIAVHEFGHNVEQTITLHNVDHYFMHGVPNTAFTEAVAFMFQARDMELLGVKTDNSQAEAMAVLDNFWSAVEIMGVSIVDMEVWKWMYENPEATPAELREAVVRISTEVWNTYYADVFGVNDSPILAIYSHMIDAPLYLSNYPLGHLVEFQMIEFMKDKDFSDELTRSLEAGRLIPQMWMQNAVGESLSGDPLIEATEMALETL